METDADEFEIVSDPSDDMFGNRPLPTGWEVYKHCDGRQYYFNSVDHHFQWERPTRPASDLPVPMTNKTPSACNPANTRAGKENELSLSSATMFTEAAATSQRVAGHINPHKERKCGELHVAYVQGEGAANVEPLLAKRRCVIDQGMLYIMHVIDSCLCGEAKIDLADVAVSLAAELDCGCAHAVCVEMSGEMDISVQAGVTVPARRIMLACESSEAALAWQMALGRVSTALRNWNRLRAAPVIVGSGIARVGKIAAQAGLSWRLGCESASAHGS